MILDSLMMLHYMSLTQMLEEKLKESRIVEDKIQAVASWLKTGVLEHLCTYQTMVYLL